MPENRTLRWAAALAAAVLGAAALVAARGHDARAQDVGEKLLLDNDRVMVYEFLFPPGFRGEEHAAVANELAYVLDGEFVVVTKGQGTRIVKRGEVEYAAKGTIHASLNETSRPARVLVVMLKGH
jgi:quercetin dioxygenase-like cupin family protein